ncbi:MAG: phosphoglycerate kinase [Dehalococcoidia bacterium]|nr:phosphoglycerate kinase [Dehalococcoidia bacterium]
MQKQTIADVNLVDKRVLLRVDYNVQFDDSGAILDDHRLKESIPTIRALKEQGARIVICSHRGRPNGVVVEELRNAPVASHLSALLGEEVLSLDDAIGPPVSAVVDSMKPGDIVLLENVRFYPGEETNDPGFARALSELADVFVSDAFGTAHRAHASVVGVGFYLPAVSGLLMQKELDYLNQVTESIERPFGIILGGGKVSEKLRILGHLADKADVICVGGGIANTFLQGQGIDVGDSLVEESRIDDALSLMRIASGRKDLKLVLPTDVVISDSSGGVVSTVSVNRIPPGFRILDLGRQTLEDIREALRPMRTIVWNGPVGLFERSPFDTGSIELAKILADSVAATTVVGGGETAAAVAKAGVADRLSHVSTGGGASLKMLEGTLLPGVEVLLDKE